jgi:hypothetical protein
MPNFTSWGDQILDKLLPNNGSIYIVVEWRVCEKIWGTNSRVSEAIENQYIHIESHVTMPKLEKILAFSSNRAKLTLSLAL